MANGDSTNVAIPAESQPRPAKLDYFGLRMNEFSPMEIMNRISPDQKLVMINPQLAYEKYGKGMKRDEFEKKFSDTQKEYNTLMTDMNNAMNSSVIKPDHGMIAPSSNKTRENYIYNRGVPHDPEMAVMRYDPMGKFKQLQTRENVAQKQGFYLDMNNNKIPYAGGGRGLSDLWNHLWKKNQMFIVQDTDDGPAYKLVDAHQVHKDSEIASVLGTKQMHNGWMHSFFGNVYNSFFPHITSGFGSAMQASDDIYDFFVHGKDMPGFADKWGQFIQNASSMSMVPQSVKSKANPFSNSEAFMGTFGHVTGQLANIVFMRNRFSQLGIPPSANQYLTSGIFSLSAADSFMREAREHGIPKMHQAFMFPAFAATTMWIETQFGPNILYGTEAFRKMSQVQREFLAKQMTGKNIASMSEKELINTGRNLSKVAAATMYPFKKANQYLTAGADFLDSYTGRRVFGAMYEEGAEEVMEGMIDNVLMGLHDYAVTASGFKNQDFDYIREPDAFGADRYYKVNPTTGEKTEITGAMFGEYGAKRKFYLQKGINEAYKEGKGTYRPTNPADHWAKTTFGRTFEGVVENAFFGALGGGMFGLKGRHFNQEWHKKNVIIASLLGGHKQSLIDQSLKMVENNELYTHLEEAGKAVYSDEMGQGKSVGEMQHQMLLQQIAAAEQLIEDLGIKDPAVLNALMGGSADVNADHSILEDLMEAMENVGKHLDVNNEEGKNYLKSKLDELEKPEEGAQPDPVYTEVSNKYNEALDDYNASVRMVDEIKSGRAAKRILLRGLIFQSDEIQKKKDLGIQLASATALGGNVILFNQVLKEYKAKLQEEAKEKGERRKAPGAESDLGKFINQLLSSGKGGKSISEIFESMVTDEFLETDILTSAFTHDIATALQMSGEDVQKLGFQLGESQRYGISPQSVRENSVEELLRSKIPDGSGDTRIDEAISQFETTPTEELGASINKLSALAEEFGLTEEQYTRAKKIAEDKMAAIDKLVEDKVEEAALKGEMMDPKDVELPPAAAEARGYLEDILRISADRGLNRTRIDNADNAAINLQAYLSTVARMPKIKEGQASITSPDAKIGDAIFEVQSQFETLIEKWENSDDLSMEAEFMSTIFDQIKLRELFDSVNHDVILEHESTSKPKLHPDHIPNKEDYLTSEQRKAVAEKLKEYIGRMEKLMQRSEVQSKAREGRMLDQKRQHIAFRVSIAADFANSIKDKIKDADVDAIMNKLAIETNLDKQKEYLTQLESLIYKHATSADRARIAKKYLNEGYGYHRGQELLSGSTVNELMNAVSLIEGTNESSSEFRAWYAINYINEITRMDSYKFQQAFLPILQHYPFLFSYEQELMMRQVAAFYTDKKSDGYSFILDMYNEANPESKTKQMFAPNAPELEALMKMSVMIRGFAGAGKTTAIAGLVDVISNVTGKQLKVVIGAPSSQSLEALTDSLARSKNSSISILSQHSGKDGSSFVDSVLASNELQNADIVILDEASRINYDEITRIGKSIKKGKIFFVGDEYQMLPDDASAQQPHIVRYAERTFPLTEVYRSGIADIWAVQEKYRLALQVLKSEATPPARTEYNNMYGVFYTPQLKDEGGLYQAFVNDFMNTKTQEVVLIAKNKVERSKIIQILEDKYGATGVADNVKHMEIGDEHSAEGWQYDRVYVAITPDNFTKKERGIHYARYMLSATSRAKNKLVMVNPGGVSELKDKLVVTDPLTKNFKRGSTVFRFPSSEGSITEADEKNNVFKVRWNKPRIPEKEDSQIEDVTKNDPVFLKSQVQGYINMAELVGSPMGSTQSEPKTENEENEENEETGNEAEEGEYLSELEGWKTNMNVEYKGRAGTIVSFKVEGGVNKVKIRYDDTGKTSGWINLDNILKTDLDDIFNDENTGKDKRNYGTSTKQFENDVTHTIPEYYIGDTFALPDANEYLEIVKIFLEDGQIFIVTENSKGEEQAPIEVNKFANEATAGKWNLLISDIKTSEYDNVVDMPGGRPFSLFKSSAVKFSDDGSMYVNTYVSPVRPWTKGNQSNNVFTRTKLKLAEHLSRLANSEDVHVTLQYEAQTAQEWMTDRGARKFNHAVIIKLSDTHSNIIDRVIDEARKEGELNEMSQDEISSLRNDLTILGHLASVNHKYDPSDTSLMEQTDFTSEKSVQQLILNLKAGFSAYSKQSGEHDPYLSQVIDYHQSLAMLRMRLAKGATYEAYMDTASFLPGVVKYSKTPRGLANWMKKMEAKGVVFGTKIRMQPSRDPQARPTSKFQIPFSQGGQVGHVELMMPIIDANYIDAMLDEIKGIKDIDDLNASKAYKTVEFNRSSRIADGHKIATNFYGMDFTKYFKWAPDYSRINLLYDEASNELTDRLHFLTSFYEDLRANKEAMSRLSQLGSLGSKSESGILDAESTKKIKTRATDIHAPRFFVKIGPEDMSKDNSNVPGDGSVIDDLPTAFKKRREGQNIDWVTKIEVENILNEILGPDFVNGRNINGDPNLNYKISLDRNGVDLLGLMHNASIDLLEVDGLVGKEVARHEAWHILYNHMLDLKSREKIRQEVAMTMNKANPDSVTMEEADEYMAEYFEKADDVKPKTNWQRFVLWVKNALRKAKLYRPDVQTIIEMANEGYYKNEQLTVKYEGPVRTMKDRRRAKNTKLEVVRLDDHASMPAVFGSPAAYKRVIDIMNEGFALVKKRNFDDPTQPPIVDEVPITKAFYQQIVARVSNENFSHRTNLGKKRLKDITSDNVHLLDNDSKERYMYFKLADEDIYYTVADNIFPQIRHKKEIYTNKKTGEQRVEYTSYQEKKQEDSIDPIANDRKDLYPSMSSFVKSHINSTRLWRFNEQEVNPDTGRMRRKKPYRTNEYVNPVFIHKALIDAAMLTLAKPDDANIVETFGNNLRLMADYAIGSNEASDHIQSVFRKFFQPIHEYRGEDASWVTMIGQTLPQFEGMGWQANGNYQFEKVRHYEYALSALVSYYTSIVSKDHFRVERSRTMDDTGSFDNIYESVFLSNGVVDDVKNSFTDSMFRVMVKPSPNGNILDRTAFLKEYHLSYNMNQPDGIYDRNDRLIIGLEYLKKGGVPRFSINMEGRDLATVRGDLKKMMRMFGIPVQKKTIELFLAGKEGGVGFNANDLANYLGHFTMATMAYGTKAADISSGKTALVADDIPYLITKRAIDSPTMGVKVDNLSDIGQTKEEGFAGKVESDEKEGVLRAWSHSFFVFNRNIAQAESYVRGNDFSRYYFSVVGNRVYKDVLGSPIFREFGFLNASLGVEGESLSIDQYSERFPRTEVYFDKDGNPYNAIMDTELFSMNRIRSYDGLKDNYRGAEYGTMTEKDLAHSFIDAMFIDPVTSGMKVKKYGIPYHNVSDKGNLPVFEFTGRHDIVKFTSEGVKSDPKFLQYVDNKIKNKFIQKNIRTRHSIERLGTVLQMMNFDFGKHTMEDYMGNVELAALEFHAFMKQHIDENNPEVAEQFADRLRSFTELIDTKDYVIKRDRNTDVIIDIRPGNAALFNMDIESFTKKERREPGDDVYNLENYNKIIGKSGRELRKAIHEIFSNRYIAFINHLERIGYSSRNYETEEVEDDYGDKKDVRTGRQGWRVHPKLKGLFKGSHLQEKYKGQDVFWRLEKIRGQDAVKEINVTPQGIKFGNRMKQLAIEKGGELTEEEIMKLDQEMTEKYKKRALAKVNGDESRVIVRTDKKDPGIKYVIALTDNVKRVNHPVYEAYFYMWHVMDSNISELVQGDYSQYKSITDYFKRTSMVQSPGYVGNVSANLGVGEVSKVAILKSLPSQLSAELRFIMGNPRNSTIDPTDGLGLITFLGMEGLQRNYGAVQGIMGSGGMLKPRYTHYDKRRDLATDFKYALLNISGETMDNSPLLEDLTIKSMSPSLQILFKELRQKRIDGKKLTLGKIGQIMYDEIDLNGRHDEYIDQFVFEEAVKTGLRGVNDIHAPNTPDQVNGDFGTWNTIDIDNEGLVIQLNPEKDVTEMHAKFFKQLIAEMNVLPGINEERTKIVELVQSILAEQTFDGIREQVQKKGLQEVMRSIGLDQMRKLNDLGPVQQLAMDPEVSIEIPLVRNKLMQYFLNEISKGIDIEISGVRMTQAPGTFFRVFEDQDGNVYTKTEMERFSGMGIKFSEARELNHMTFLGDDGTNVGNEAQEAWERMKVGLDLSSREGRAAAEQRWIGIRKGFRDRITEVLPGEVMLSYSYMRDFKLEADQNPLGRDLTINDVFMIYTNDGKVVNLANRTDDEIRKFFLDDTKGQTGSIKYQGLPKFNNIDVNKTVSTLLNPDSVTDPANYIIEFRKTLDVVGARIPSSSTSSGFHGKVVGFINDNSNVIYTSSKKNILDGSDYDIDELSIFYRSIQKASKDRKVNVPEYNGAYTRDQMHSASTDKLTNILFDQMYNYYSDATVDPETGMTNIDVHHSPIDLAELEKAARKFESKTNNRTRLFQPHDVASSMHNYEQAHQGSRMIGPFANAIVKYGYMVTMPPDVIPGFTLKANGMDQNDERLVIDFLSSLLNAATDNAKVMLLGSLNAKMDSANFIIAMAIEGYSPEQVFTLLGDWNVRRILGRANWKKSIGQYSSGNIFDYIEEARTSIVKGIDDKADELMEAEIITEDDWNKMATPEQNIYREYKESDPVWKQGRVSHKERLDLISSYNKRIASLKRLAQFERLSFKGESLFMLDNVLKMRNGFNSNGIAPFDYDFDRAIKNIEFVLDMSLDRYIIKGHREVVNAERQKKKPNQKRIDRAAKYNSQGRGMDLSAGKAYDRYKHFSKSADYMERQKIIRSQIDFEKFFRNLPQFDTYLKILSEVKRMLGENLVRNSPAIKEAEKMFLEYQNMDFFYSNKDYYAFYEELEKFFLAMYFNQKYRGRKFKSTFGLINQAKKKDYSIDLTNPEGRYEFIMHFPGYIQQIKEGQIDQDKYAKYASNKFLQRIRINADVNGSNIELEDYQSLSEEHKQEMREEFMKLPIQLKTEFSLYQLIRYQFTRKKGSFSEIIDHSYFKEYSQFLNSTLKPMAFGNASFTMPDGKTLTLPEMLRVSFLRDAPLYNRSLLRGRPKNMSMDPKHWIHYTTRGEYRGSPVTIQRKESMAEEDQKKLGGFQVQGIMSNRALPYRLDRGGVSRIYNPKRKEYSRDLIAQGIVVQVVKRMSDENSYELLRGGKTTVHFPRQHEYYEKVPVITADTDIEYIPIRTYTPYGEVIATLDPKDPTALILTLKERAFPNFEASVPLSKGNKISQDATRVIMNMINKAFPNVEIVMINNPAVKGTPMEGKAGFLMPDGKVYLNEDLIQADTPFHEVAGHVIMKIIKNEDPDAYNRLTNEMLENPENNGLSADVIAEIEAKYPGISGERLGEELFSTLAGMVNEDKIIRPSEPYNPSLVEKVLNWVKNVWTEMKANLIKAIGYTSNTGTLHNTDLSTVTINDLIAAIADDIKKGKVVTTADTDLIRSMVTEMEAQKVSAVRQVTDIKSILQPDSMKSWEQAQEDQIISYIDDRLSASYDEASDTYTYSEANIEWTYSKKMGNRKQWIKKEIYPVVSGYQRHKASEDVIKYMRTGDPEPFQYSSHGITRYRFNAGVMDELGEHFNFRPEFGETIDRFSNVFNIPMFNGDDPIVIKHSENDYSIFQISPLSLNFKISRYPGQAYDKFTEPLSDNNIYNNFLNRVRSHHDGITWKNTQGDLSRMVLAFQIMKIKQMNPDARFRRVGIVHMTKDNFSAKYLYMPDDVKVVSYMSKIQSIMDQLPKEFRELLENEELLKGDNYDQSYSWMLNTFYQGISSQDFTGEESLMPYGETLRDALSDRGLGPKMTRMIKLRMKHLKTLKKGVESEEYHMLSKALYDIKTAKIHKIRNAVKDLDWFEKYFRTPHNMENDVVQYAVAEVKKSIRRIVDNVETFNKWHSEELKKLIKAHRDNNPSSKIGKFLRDDSHIIFAPLFKPRKAWTYVNGNKTLVDVNGMELYHAVKKNGQWVVEDPETKKAIAEGKLTREQAEYTGKLLEKLKEQMVLSIIHERAHTHRFNSWDTQKEEAERIYDEKWRPGQLPAMDATYITQFYRGDFRKSMKTIWRTMNNPMYLFEQETNEDERINNKFYQQLDKQDVWGAAVGLTNISGEYFGTNDENTQLEIAGEGGAEVNGNLETNLEVIMRHFFLMSARQIEFETNTLYHVDAAKSILYNFRQSEGRELKNQIQWLDMLGRRLIYNKSSEDDPMSNVMGLNLKPAAQLMLNLTTFTGMAFNMFSGVTSATANNFQIWTNAIANQYAGSDLYGADDAAIAYARYASDAPNGFNLINGLINQYQLVEMTEKDMLHNPRHLETRDFVWRSQYMYWFNWVTDYTARGLVMTAQMHKDGTLDAHYVAPEDNHKKNGYTYKKGEIVYDDRKDRRFYNADGTQSKEQKLLWRHHKKIMIAEELMTKDNKHLPRAYEYQMAQRLKTIADKDIVGGYDQTTYGNLEMYVMGRMFTQFRKFMVERLQNFYQPGFYMQEYGNWKVNLEKETVEWEKMYMEGKINSFFKLGSALIGAHSMSGREMWDTMSTRQKANIAKGVQDIVAMISFATMKSMVGMDDLKRNDYIRWRLLRSMEYAVEDLVSEVNPKMFLRTINEPLPTLNFANNLFDIFTYTALGDLERSAYLTDRVMPFYAGRRAIRSYYDPKK